MVNKEKLLQIVQNIYRDLIYDARKGTNGIFWETINLVPNEHQVLKDVNETLVNGVSGILVFLMEYYKQTGDDTAIEKMRQTGEWLVQYCQEKEIYSVGFYYGRSGVAYTLIELSLLLNDDTFLESAEAIVGVCHTYTSLNRRVVPASFANGISGLLYVQLMVLKLTQKQSVADEIAENLEILSTHLRTNDAGVHFDELFYCKKPLISFSDGNSGIAHVLIQLAVYFDNETLKTLSRQLFDYENSCYSPSTRNWPDFASTDFFNRNKSVYAKNAKSRNKKFFDVESDSVSWHMGAPSVGFSRITAVLAGMDEYKDDIRKAIDKTVFFLRESVAKQKENKFTLLTGLSGPGLFLLDAQKLNANQDFRPLLSEIAGQAIEQYEKLSYFKSDHYFATEVADNTLFTGECGVGYFFIQLLREDRGQTILSPRLEIQESSRFKFEQFNLNSVYRALLTTYYPQSSNLFTKNNQELAFNLGGLPFSKIHDSYATCLKNVIDDSNAIRSVYNFELQKIKLMKGNDNFLFTYVRNKSLQEEHIKFLENTDDKKLLKSRLFLNENCRLTHFENGEKKYFALKTIFNGVHEMPLNVFSYSIFNAFITPVTVGNAIENIIRSTGAITERDAEEIKELTLKQVRQGIKVALLSIKKVELLGIRLS